MRSPRQFLRDWLGISSLTAETGEVLARHEKSIQARGDEFRGLVSLLERQSNSADEAAISECFLTRLEPKVNRMIEEGSATPSNVGIPEARLLVRTFRALDLSGNEILGREAEIWDDELIAQGKEPRYGKRAAEVEE